MSRSSDDLILYKLGNFLPNFKDILKMSFSDVNNHAVFKFNLYVYICIICILCLDCFRANLVVN